MAFDKAEPKNLLIALMPEGNPDIFIELILYFEEKQKCTDTKEYLEFRREEQIEKERELVEKFLIEVCEDEITKV